MIRRLATAALSVTALLALTACGADSSADAAGSGSEVTLTVGDQAKTLQTIVAASGALKGAEYNVKWAEFEGAAPSTRPSRRAPPTPDSPPTCRRSRPSAAG